MRRLLALAGVLASAFVLTSSALAATTVTTAPGWDGSGQLTQFGATGSGATPTYGQVIQGNDQALSSFTFTLDLPATTIFHGGVYVWAGNHVGAELWQGEDVHTSGLGLEEVTFDLPGGVVLDAGTQYILLATTIFSAGSGSGGWGAFIDDGGYPDTFAEWSNSTAPTALTDAWDGTAGWADAWDIAFTAVFGSATPDVVPDRAGYCSVAGDTWPDGSAIVPGTFLDLVSGQVSDDGHYAGAVPANYLEGVGITCDALPATYARSGWMDGFYPYYAARA
jgi:hypothetical protein